MGRLSIVTEPQSIKLKQLGFNWGCRKMHGELEGYNGLHDYENYNQSNEESQYSAPETVVALKWIRENTNSLISIHYHLGINKKNPKNEWFWRFIENKTSIPTEGSGGHQIYEDAESAGLDFALDYLLKQKSK